MKSWRIVTALVLSLVLVSSIACLPSGSEEVVEQLAEVTRGDLMAMVSGSGNIKVSREMKLTFGSGGRVETIFVEEGDRVSQGDILARLETDALELALTTARLAHTQARVAAVQAEAAVAEAEVALTTAEIAVTQAEINLKNANIALEQTEQTATLSDIDVAQAEVDAARRDLEEALWTLSKYDPGTVGYDGYQERVIQAEARLNTAEDRRDAMLYGFDTKEVAVKKQQVAAAEQSLELAQQSLELAEQSLEIARLSPEVAEQTLEQTRQALAQAQKQLDEATIRAPFDGVVAEIPVDEGDTVSTATTILYLIDPGSMELNVQMDEIDITEVTPGQRAIIEVDALPALPIDGKVSSISLLPAEVAGVIVYDVKIEFDVPEGAGLRTGMSATADIVIAERSNVLLVPDRAIKQDSRGNLIVKVMVNEQIEERIVVAGISDGFQTEILDGLKEGEVVER